MVIAETKLPQSQEGFSRELEEIIKNIKYNQILLRHLTKGVIHKKVVEKYAKDANINRISSCNIEDRDKLCKLWKQLRLYYDSAQEKRESFLRQLISKKEDQDDHIRKKAILTLLKRQEQPQDLGKSVEL